MTLAPFSAVSTLYDTGDGPNGTGLEVAGGLRLEATGRRLVLHSDASYEEQGFSLNARFGGGMSQQGWHGSLRQSWGTPGYGAETLWQDQFSPAEQQQRGAGHSSNGVDGRLGYGIAVGGSKLLSAFGSYGQMRGSRRIEMGLNLGGIGLFGFGPDNPMLVEFAGERYDAGGLSPDYRMRLYGIIRFGGETPSLRCDPEAGPCPAAGSGLGGWSRTRTELTPGAAPAAEEEEGAEEEPSGR